MQQTRSEEGGMAQKWKQRPEGSNWGDFGPDDQIGRLNLLTSETTVKAAKEVKEGLRFCLSLPLDVPATNVLNIKRQPPQMKPVMRDGLLAFDLRLSEIDPRLTEVNCDESWIISPQHSTQWDSFAHMGYQFDADGDGEPENVYYNGHHVHGDESGKPRFGEVGTHNLGIEHMAKACIQGRGVMIDFHAHFGREHKAVGYDDLMRIMESDGVEVEKGDLVCLHTGYADMVIEQGKDLDPDITRKHCPGIDSWDEKVLQWITDSGLAALISDNRAVEFEHYDLAPGIKQGPWYPIHHHCLFKLGIHLGELWFLSELAGWLREHKRHRFLLTAPPLYLPGAVGSPLNPIATV